MKYIFKEYKGNYDKYEYPYKIYAKAEKNDSVDTMYQKGFLPTRIGKNNYYLSRNIRVNLKNFSLTSENKRILRKTQNLILENKDLKNFAFEYDIAGLATDYFKKKFKKKIISTQSLKRLFSGDFFTNVLVYKSENQEVGYCITMETEEILHYAYPFYKSDLISTNTGIGMMTKAIEFAKENNKKYVYLGTAYTLSSLYKTQFKAIEWFDGTDWNKDLEKLKDKIKEENK